MSPKLSIVMPCYVTSEELAQLTRGAVHSFNEADIDSYELILVDDASTWKVGELREHADTYVRHKKNKGFIKSVNDGLQLARGEFVLVTNNDVRAAPNFFKVAKEILESDDDIVSVHPRMTYYNETMEYGDKVFAEGRERWCQSSFFVIRNNLYLFPEEYAGTGGAYEDWAYWSRLRRQGLKTAYTTKTCFQHRDSSTTQLVGENSKQHKSNLDLFIKEFGKSPEDYYMSLYPEQMVMHWRREFTKL